MQFSISQSTASFALVTWSRLDDICSGVKVRHRATIVQKKTGRPVKFEITEQSRSSVEAWLPMLQATGSRSLFPTRLRASPHISIRQCPTGASLGRKHSLGDGLVRHALDAAYKGSPDLLQNRQPARRADPPRPHEAGEHRSISRDRS